MKKYHVTYYYLATGMEGRADTADYGYWMAESAQEAIEACGKSRYPKSDELTQTWGLSAKLIPNLNGINELANLEIRQPLKRGW